MRVFDMQTTDGGCGEPAKMRQTGHDIETGGYGFSNSCNTFRKYT